MSRRPLVFVLGLTVGDYFLWNWSLNSNHDVLALISGLTFPPLALMLLWLLAMAAARLLARTARRPADRRRNATARTARSAGARARASGTQEQPSRSAPARKIAA